MKALQKLIITILRYKRKCCEGRTRYQFLKEYSEKSSWILMNAYGKLGRKVS